MKKSFLDQIHKTHCQRLNNLHVPHKKLLICFSAIPGSGKTYIAKHIEDTYKAVRLNNDDIRDIIKNVAQTSTQIKETVQEILEAYLFYFLQSYSFENGFIIMDGSIDRIYKKLFLELEFLDFGLFIIRIQCSPIVIKQRILHRNKEGAKNYFAALRRWKKDYENFGKYAQADILIENNEKLNLKPLYMILNKLF